MTQKLRVFHKLQVAHSALFRAADQRTRSELDLTITQLAVLYVLKEKDGLPISEISSSLAMGKSSLTGLVDRMCDKRLVRRIESPTDGRITLIYLEDIGREAVATSKHKTDLFNQALLEPFSPAEQETINRFLTHITQNSASIINGDTVQQESVANVR